MCNDPRRSAGVSRNHLHRLARKSLVETNTRTRPTLEEELVLVIETAKRLIPSSVAMVRIKPPCPYTPPGVSTTDVEYSEIYTQLFGKKANGHPNVVPAGVNSNSLAQFRLIPRIETYPAVVSFAQTSVGKFVMLALFGLGIRFFIPNSVSVVLLAFIFGLITFMPEYRRVT